MSHGTTALDEAHEMAINKDFKSAVVKPTTEYLAMFLTTSIQKFESVIWQQWVMHTCRHVQCTT